MSGNWAVPVGGTFDVIAVRYGALEARRRALYASYDVYGQPDAPLQMDYFFWIVRGGGRTVVVDTGFSPAVGAARGRDTLCEPKLALERLGIAPTSVTDVVLTHFHYDHIGNVDLFPDARLVADVCEYAFWTGPYGRRPVPSAPVEAAEVELLQRARDDGRLVLVPEQDAGLPTGIELLELPGHTPGQLGVSVPTKGSRVVLASDAAHLYEELHEDMPFHVYSDIEGMYRGLEVLRQLDAREDTIVVPGHDPDVMRRFPVASDDTADIAVVLS
jgi:glyoxylase-like metal-dependent hydrolase (beta-lactamase superfamily II)